MSEGELRMRMNGKRRPAGSPKSPVRSIRVDERTWSAARKRAERDGVTMSQVVLALVDMYGRGVVDLPEVRTIYPRRVAEVVTDEAQSA